MFNMRQTDSGEILGTTHDGKFTRRSFIKGAAALTATGMLAGCSPQTKNLETESVASVAGGQETIYRGACRAFCTGGCSLNLHVLDGELVRTSAGDYPDPSYRRICTKGLTEPYRVYAADRLQYPMRRTGERGSGEFERISWDEAINEIAEKWQSIIEESGPTAIGTLTDTGNNAFLGSGIMAMTTGSMVARFKKAFGFTTLDSVNDRAATFAIKRMLGSDPICQSNEPVDYKNCKTILIWSAFPAGAQVQTSHFFSEARDAGTRIIYIDPVFNQSSIIASEWVPLRSGSDGALAMGMISAIVENGWEDTDFLKKHTNAPFLVKEDNTILRLSDLGKAAADSDTDDYVVFAADGSYGAAKEVADPLLEAIGQDIDGHTVTTAYSLLLQRVAEYPVSRAAELSGVPEEKIIDIAKAYACDTPAAIYSVFGTDHYYNGHWSFSCMMTLPMLTGNLGRSGSFIECYREAPTSFLNLKEVTNVNGPEKSGPVVACSNIPQIMESGMYGEKPFKLRAMYVHSANPLVNLAARKKVIEWFDSLEHIVVTDVRMTDTCKWADILLPACHWFEYEDVCGRGMHHPYILWNDKALDPLYESKPDYEIFQLIAAALGRGDDFNFTPESWFNMLFDTDEARERGISYDDLKNKKVLRMIPDKTHIAYEGAEFGTESKRAEFFIEQPKASNPYSDKWDLDKERLPYWEPPAEVWPESEQRKKYPYQLMSEKPKFRTHSQWGNVELFREYESEPFVRMNPADAQQAGIETGDTVKLFNDRGYVVIKVEVVPNLPEGILTLTKGWSADDYIDGNYSDLTPLEMNGFCANQPFFDTVVGLEKA